MNKWLIMLTFLAGVLFNPVPSSSQRVRPGRKESPLEVNVSQFPTLQADSVRVEIFTKIPLDRLVFMTHGKDFKAAYELSIFAIDENEVVCGTRIWQEEVVKSRFKDTQSEDLYHIAHTYFSLPPSKYRIVVNLVDMDNRQRYNVSEKVDVAGYPGDQLAMGDILLLSEIQGPPEKPDHMVPYVDDEIPEGVDSFYAYVVVRNPVETSQATLEYTLAEKDETSVAASSGTLNLGWALSTHVIPIATDQLKGREYTLTLRLQVDTLEAEQSIPIHVIWTGFSGQIEDVDQAIEQTRYMATHKQLKKMRDATGEAKREAFLAFWREYDPTPNTPRNELMDEYYSRVEYANAHFRGHRPGWETDLGMVYIIYGQPDDIERHPFDMYQKPYQIWFYYDEGWKFVFVDVNMFGDYRLVTPLYPSRSF